MIGSQALRRLANQVVLLVAVVLAATALTFVVTEVLPGDAAIAILGDTATPDQIASLRQELGLERPLVVRYADWLAHAAQGDLGRSYRTRESIGVMIGQRLPVTAELILITQLMALLMAMPAGVLAAYRARSGIDHTLGALSIALLSTPGFVIGIGLIYWLSVSAGLFPASGYSRLSEGLGANLRSMFLPALTLALAEFPVYMRILRADMIATLQQDFILVARAKGLAVRDILVRHALRPSSLSLATVVGINLGRLVGGAVIVESLFALPGIGQMMVNAVYQRDNFVIQGVVLVVAVGFVVINLAVDMMYAVLDPRVRHGLGR